MVLWQNKNMATLPNMALKTIFRFKNLEMEIPCPIFSFLPTQAAHHSDTFLPPVTTYVY